MTNKADYFRTFCSISRAFGSTKDKDALLPLIVDSAIGAMDGKAACLFLSQKDRDFFVPVCQKGLSSNYLHSNPIHAKAIVEKILTGGYLAFKDATADPRLENLEAKKAEGIASILTVPVMVDGAAIGILSLYTATQRDFSQDEIDFLKALAEQGGMAIKHAQLLELVERNTRLFLDLSAAINASLDIKKILYHLTESIVTSLELKGATIRLLDKDKKRLVLVAHYGMSDHYLNVGAISVMKGLSKNMDKIQVIENVSTDERCVYRDVLLKEGVQALVSVPMVSKGKFIGVLRLFSNRKEHFPQETIMLMSALAHHGAIAIENASAYMTLEDDIKGLREDIWSHRSWF